MFLCHPQHYRGSTDGPLRPPPPAYAPAEASCHGAQQHVLSLQSGLLVPSTKWMLSLPPSRGLHSQQRKQSKSFPTELVDYPVPQSALAYFTAQFIAETIWFWHSEAHWAGGNAAMAPMWQLQTLRGEGRLRYKQQSTSAHTAQDEGSKGCAGSILLNCMLRSKMGWDAYQNEQETCYLCIHTAVFLLSKITRIYSANSELKGCSWISNITKLATN